jgi:Domain of unknown function (DUF4844)
MAEDKLTISTAQLSKLAEMRVEPKYIEEAGTLYNGLRPDSARLEAERQLNDLIERLSVGLPVTPTKQFVLSEFARTLAEFKPNDTEDRECLLRYLERIMDILGIESSNGLLNRWLYGDHLAGLLEKLPRPTGPRSN